MNRRHAICIVVDGLRASALGTYGNTSFPTPQLDALAARSLVVEWLWANSPSLEGFYRNAWNDSHAVPGLLQQAGVMQCLATDDPWLTQQSTNLPFDEALLVETHADKPAGEIEDTAVAQLFSLVVERIAQWREDIDQKDSMLWLHTRGFLGPWDAPQSLRAEFLEEDDPPPADYLEPPTEARQVEDPDALLTHRVAYAAQVAVLDACIGALMQAIEREFLDSETLIMLVGSQGFALGEHGSIGSDCQELFSERLHLPWLLHLCGNALPVPRCSGLAQPVDMGATLVDWFGATGMPNIDPGISLVPQLFGKQVELRDTVVAHGIGGEQAVRTQDWLLRSVPAAVSNDAGAQPTIQLYSKPDDRWECNDVAVRCPEEVEILRALLQDSNARQCASS